MSDIQRHEGAEAICPHCNAPAPEGWRHGPMMKPHIGDVLARGRVRCKGCGRLYAVVIFANGGVHSIVRPNSPDKHYRLTNLPPKPCEVCGTPFYYWGHVPLEKQHTCSPECGHERRRRSPEEARRDFMARVEKQPDGCWRWTGPSNDSGYGIFLLNGRRHRAHRWLYEALVGPIPAGLQGCHHCDNPICVNPEHIFLGSARDNARDMARKGRAHKGPSAFGEGHALSKLTGEQVAAIFVDPRPAAQVSAQYGVSPSLVSNIWTRKAWRHVTSNLVSVPRRSGPRSGVSYPQYRVKKRPRASSPHS